MIVLDGLTKQFGDKRAVDGLSVTIRPGLVTGFLGPNGAGKTSTMRMLLGLDRPTAGTALIGGQCYADLATPLRTVGALLDPRTGMPGQRASSHLLGMARSNGIPVRRVDEVLAEVGLAEMGGRRIGTFSLGMRQRLGIAAALLGEPEVLLFDEPVNGLDPDGVAWIRRLMRSQAAEGRTVFVSSHLMSEMQSTADHLVVIGRGKLIADDSIDNVISGSALNSITVRSPQAGALRSALEAAGLTVQRTGADDRAGGGPDPTTSLAVTGGTLEQVGAIAFTHGLQLNELSVKRASLEQAYGELTGSSVEYSSATSSKGNPS
ncbi:ATP-binding cassette domain-containing protein [Micrococcaceae bacterium RIT802]|nr:ATP-binding cassette domain-containing protein [Micrococcaceae bacterium RIT 802]